ncbi:MAG: NUDIX hydrolase [Rhizobacter sp.]
MKRTSCGVLVFSAERELLLCHLTGTPYWDLPKGLAEAGESDRDAAIRETAEECGLQLSADDLLDLGSHAYRPSKDLHLYAVRLEDATGAVLECRARFVDRWGRQRPEVDDFLWADLAAVPERCAPSMTRVLMRIGLPAVLEQLAAKAPAKASAVAVPPTAP